MNQFVSGAYGFEVLLSASSNKVYLPDVAYLRGKRIKHIDVLPTSITDRNILFRDHYKNLFLTITEQNTQTELIRSLPISLLYQDIYSPVNRIFINKNIDFQHSYIDTSSLSSGDKDNQIVYFVVWFDDPQVWGTVSTKNNQTEIHPLELQLTGKKTFFGYSSTLLNRRVQNLILSFPKITPQGRDGLNISFCRSKFITLSRGQREFFKDVPISLFYQINNQYPLLLQNIVFDLQTSYITTTSTSEEYDLKSVFFNVVIDDNASVIKR